MKSRHLVVSTLLGLAAMSTHAADDWITPAEASHFRTTPNLDDTLTYLNRIT